MRRLFFKHSRFHAVPLAGIDHCAGSIRVSLRHIFNLYAVFCDNLHDRKIKFLCKFKVTVIMRRYTHNGSCSIICKYIVRQPDRCLFSVQRIDGITPCKYSRLFLILQTVYIGLHRRIVNILFYRRFRLRCGQRCRQLMLRSQHHEGGSI